MVGTGETHVACKVEYSVLMSPPSPAHTHTHHTVPTQTTSEESRASSSMGCLEPRPLSQSSPDDNGEVLPSPKDIRNKLMEKMTYLTPEGVVTDHEEGGAASVITSSHSSHSLNSGTTTKGISFGSIFKRCGEHSC